MTPNRRGHMASYLGRRKFLATLLGGAAVAWPLAARAQQPTMPVIGFLAEGTPASEPDALPAFRQGLRDAGYVEGQNVQIDYRWSGEQRDLLLALTADLVRRKVTVIYSARGSAVAQAAKAATTTIPIVFTNGGDPVKLGLVASLNRPGGKVTGTTFFSNVLTAKRLTLLRDLVPSAVDVAALINPTNANVDTDRGELQTAARANMAIEYRWAEGQYDRLPELAADLVHRRVDVIAATGGPAALAAQAASATIPIVFRLAADPIAAGLVASLSRPGGNVTGVTSLNLEVGPKRLEFLHELVPSATIMAALVNPTNPSNAEILSRDMQATARLLGLQLHLLHASSDADIDAVFATLTELRAGGLVIGTDAENTIAWRAIRPGSAPNS